MRRSRSSHLQSEPDVRTVEADGGVADASTARRRPAACALCDRALPLEFHHLIPRRTHRLRRFRQRFDALTRQHRGVWLCHDCHRAVHRLYDERHLGWTLNTLEALASDPRVARHVAWARRQRRA